MFAIYTLYYLLIPVACLFVGVLFFSLFLPAEWRILIKKLLWDVK